MGPGWCHGRHKVGLENLGVIPGLHPDRRTTTSLRSSDQHMHVPYLSPTPTFFVLFFPERGRISDSLGFWFFFFRVGLNLTQL